MPRPNRDEEILAAALAVFAERGYDAARIRHIAERAGVSDAALYSHHRSKEAVALALFRRHITRYSGVLREVAEARALSVEERVRGLAIRTLDAFADEPDAVAFVITHQGRFIGALPAEFAFPIRIVEALVREGQRNGSVRRGPVRLLAALVFGCIVQPIRTVLEAPPGTIDLHPSSARELVADAAWAAVSAA
ncbi:MAG TPA: helix-turn-helix domain-containing protein [Solirubrobacteraceae bacterium]|nr:helix-turn-helix domain-containing protein [Solirubrobacteraceae bacterium]